MKTWLQNATNVRFVVKRESVQENTIAIVRAKVTKPILNSMDRFLVALKVAVTEWITSNDDGRAAWQESVKDFNVGDLANYYTNTALSICLADQGIYELHIDTVCDDTCNRSWTYDTVLANDTLVP